MTDNYRLVYTSRRTAREPAIAAAEVTDIVAVASRNNELQGLRGALMASGNRFAQVLEGPRAAIERTFERICVDPRHRDVLVMNYGPSDTPAFSSFRLISIDVDDIALPTDDSIGEAIIEMASAAIGRLHHVDQAGAR